jgi:hypothetical protein
MRVHRGSEPRWARKRGGGRLKRQSVERMLKLEIQGSPFEAHRRSSPEIRWQSNDMHLTKLCKREWIHVHCLILRRIGPEGERIIVSTHSITSRCRQSRVEKSVRYKEGVVDIPTLPSFHRHPTYIDTHAPNTSSTSTSHPTPGWSTNPPTSPTFQISTTPKQVFPLASPCTLTRQVRATFPARPP